MEQFLQEIVIVAVIGVKILPADYLEETAEALLRGRPSN